MCSECADHEPSCLFCGLLCGGTCDDPDSCETCWIDKNDPAFAEDPAYEEGREELNLSCLECECLCECHDDERDGMGMRFEHGVLKDCDLDPPYERSGIFPFLTLPGEIRDQIYGYAFLQDGNRRQDGNGFHRGSIHTSLLATCRQIHNEAGDMPLSVNQLSFENVLRALDFVGFSLAATQRHLLTTVNIEFFWPEHLHPGWDVLLRELGKLPLTHLSLMIKGGIPKEALLGHNCFVNRIALHIKGLESFDVTLGSGRIPQKSKMVIQEEMREVLIEGYTRPKQPKSKGKRGATTETGGSKKKVKQTKALVRHQAVLVHSPKSGHLGMRSTLPERQAAESTKQFLLSKYEKVKEYATSLDFNVAPVKIRLENTRKAAEATNEAEFETLASDILKTLEERFASITAARNNIPAFPSAASVASSPATVI